MELVVPFLIWPLQGAHFVQSLSYEVSGWEGRGMSDVFRNWIIILISLTAGLAFASIIGEATSPEVGAALAATILLATAGIGIVDATKRLFGQTSLLGRGRGIGRVLALLQLIASVILAMSILLA